MARRACVLAEHDYQDLEAWYPILRLREAGFRVDIVGREGTGPDYKGRFGYPLRADCHVGEVRDVAYEVVVIPGGWAPDKMRRSPAVSFVFFAAQSTSRWFCAASICKSAALMAEKLAFHQWFWQSCAVNFHKRGIPPYPPTMKGTGDHIFSAAALSLDEYSRCVNLL